MGHVFGAVAVLADPADGPERAASTAAVGALISLPVVFLEAGHHPPLVFTELTLGLLAVISLGAGLGVILAHAYLTRVLGPRRTVVLLYLVPIYNVALAWLLAGEVMDWVQTVGAGLLLGGVYVAMLSGRPTPVSGHAETARAKDPREIDAISVKLEGN